MSGLQDRLKGKGEAAAKPAAAPPATDAPVRHHWREIFDDGVHHLGRLVTLFALGVAVTIGGACVSITVAHFDAEGRTAAAGEVLASLSLIDINTETELAVQSAVLDRIGPATPRVEFLWKPGAAASAFVFIVTLIATRPWRRK